MKMIYVIGGGTFSHVRNHLALAAPAFGTTARRLFELFADELDEFADELDELDPKQREYGVELMLTKMARPSSHLVTNEDVQQQLEQLIADPDTRVIVLNAALCDYDGAVQVSYPEGAKLLTRSGAHEPRLKTSDGVQTLRLRPAPKLIGELRKNRKDVFVVGFKTTTGATSDEQYATALKFLKANSLNLVLANDTVTRNNVIVAPEETRYAETTVRDVALQELVKITCARMRNTFTRSTVLPDEDLISWDSPIIPASLRTVVDHCVARGAYKSVNGATAGHFAVKIDEDTILTSRRKTNYNEPGGLDLVRVRYDGADKVIAYGAKPSVGGQSQRAVFEQHPELDCIVHFHCPSKNSCSSFGLAQQWPNECGSHECGQNTAANLCPVPGFDGKLKAVMLIGHGPNVVFSRTVDPRRIIEFIEENFDLTAKTGGRVEA